MKKILLLILILLNSPTLFSQVVQVEVNTYGKMRIYVRINDDDPVIINEYGQLIRHFNRDCHIEFYSNFHEHEAGKVKSINGILFKYHSDFHNYEEGKIKSIGSTTFKYHSDFHSYEAGKIKYINQTLFSYYSDFNDYEEGKIKSIGPHRYDYFSSFDGKLKGRLKKGQLSFTKDGITYYYQVRSTLPPPYK